MARTWQEEEDLYLLANFGKHEPELLARVLDRSEDSVRKRYYLISKKAKTPSQESPELQFFLERSSRAIPRRVRKRKIDVVARNGRISKYTGKGNPYSHTKSGYRPDIKINCRSGWEANVCRILQSYDIPFEFEPMIFPFPIKRGNKAYCPDIYLSTTEEWIEVKGYLDKNSEIKLKRFKRFYPDDFDNLTMIISKSSKRCREFCEEIDVPTVLFYEECSRIFKARLENWEGR